MLHFRLDGNEPTQDGDTTLFEVGKIHQQGMVRGCVEESGKLDRCCLTLLGKAAIKSHAKVAHMHL